MQHYVKIDDPAEAKAAAEKCVYLASEPEPTVWADAASPFTGSQVADLLRENERLRDVALAAMVLLAAYDDQSDTFERDALDELRLVLGRLG